MTTCPQCGHANLEAGARFCAACGHALSRLDAETSVEATGTLASLAAPDPDADAAEGDGHDRGADDAGVELLPPGTALLVVKRGPAAGARFLLDADVTSVGRHPDSHIFLDDITVSRRHAEFHRAGAAFRVRDVGSLNGTYVNLERIDDVALANGDEVQIGKYRLVFISGGGS